MALQGKIARAKQHFQQAITQMLKGELGVRLVIWKISVREDKVQKQAAKLKAREDRHKAKKAAPVAKSELLAVESAAEETKSATNDSGSDSGRGGKSNREEEVLVLKTSSSDDRALQGKIARAKQHFQQAITQMLKGE